MAIALRAYEASPEPLRYELSDEAGRDRGALDGARGVLLGVVVSLVVFWLPIVWVLRHIH